MSPPYAPAARCSRLRQVAWGLGLLLLLGVAAVPGDADEGLSIATILEEPDAYHLKQVTLQGTVRHLRELEPYYLPTGVGCYGAYTFALQDDSGILEVGVLGICGRPALRSPEVADGDRILLEAEIHAPGHTGYSRHPDGTLGFRLDQPNVRAVAHHITPLGR